MGWKTCHIKFFIIALPILAALALISSDALARTEARYLMRAGDAYFGNDLYNSRSIQTLFHQQTLRTTDIEHLDINFPITADNLGLGPGTLGLGIGDASPQSGGTAAAAGTDGNNPSGSAFSLNDADAPGIGASATANVLPFGPVNLAFPGLHQDSLQSLSASRTGFFTANYNYRSETDYGNIPLSPTYSDTLQQVIQPAPIFGFSQPYPEQFGKIAIRNKLKQATATTAKPADQTKPSNQTTANTTSTGDTIGTWLNQGTKNSTDMIYAPGDKLSYSMDFFKAKNASTSPLEMPVIYPWYFDMADKTVQTFPSNGIGGKFTNGAGSTGATFTMPSTPTTAGTAGNQTGSKAGNTTGTKLNRSIGTSFTTTASSPSDLTYADFNFDATTEQINSMSLLERMWRNSHRGGTMGKAYAGYTDTPLWIDPYERPYDVSMIDEHWYVLQCALNMTRPGTQILPRLWSLMW